MKLSLRHIGIVVYDLEAVLKFWTEVMEFTIINKLEESGKGIDLMLGLEKVNLTTVKLRAHDGNIIELLKFNSHSDISRWSGQPCSTGITHIALTVENLDEMYQNLNNKTLRFFNKPQLSKDGKVKVIYAEGPEGILLELVENLYDL